MTEPGLAPKSKTSQSVALRFEHIVRVHPNRAAVTLGFLLCTIGSENVIGVNRLLLSEHVSHFWSMVALLLFAACSIWPCKCGKNSTLNRERQLMLWSKAIKRLKKWRIVIALPFVVILSATFLLLSTWGIAFATLIFDPFLVFFITLISIVLGIGGVYLIGIGLSGKANRLGDSVLLSDVDFNVAARQDKTPEELEKLIKCAISQEDLE